MMLLRYIPHTLSVILALALLSCMAVVYAAPSTAPTALSPVPAVAAPITAPDELRVRVEYARTEKTPLAIVWLTIHSDYYAYAQPPGPVGKPVTLTATMAEGTEETEGTEKRLLPVLYPTGVLRADQFEPDKKIAAYTGTVPFFIDMSGVPAGKPLTAELDILLCSAKHCLPLQENVSLLLPQATLPPLSASLIQQWQEAQHNTATQTASKATVETPPAISAVQEWTFTPRHIQAHLEVKGLSKALLLGLLAGFLLNIMPCVLPVLTLKASAMLVLGSGDKAARLRAFREHNMLFAAGILTQFVLLALLLGSTKLIWGQIFQSTALVTAMLIIVFLLGLSMLGLFTLPVVDLKSGHSTSPRINAYLTGIMATLLATPCSGPLLGGVLSWAFMQPLPILVMIFLAVGVGMSAPYIVFAVRPQVVVFLPSPGAWMELLERGVGFFLLGTSLYLLSILPQDRHLPLLAALLVVAVGGWIWGHFGGINAPSVRRKILGMGMVVLTLAVVFYASRPPEPLVVWEQFTPTSFKEVLGKEPLLVEFTADWCPNCKLLEQTVLTQNNLRRWQVKYGLTLVRVDLTREDTAAKSLLQALGSNSIPLTALFPNGPMSSSPVILRDIYTTDTLEQALQEAFTGAAQTALPAEQLFPSQTSAADSPP